MKIALKLFLLMTLLLGLAYPLLITAIATLTMPFQAHGSLLKNGSSLIAQDTERERDFWPRPSAINYNPLPSGGSNLGPTSQKLKELIEVRKKKFGENAPPELLYASGSGLDPHISLQAAYYQIPRVAKARSISEEELKKQIDALAEGKQLGFLGPRYVNVQLLN